MRNCKEISKRVSGSLDRPLAFPEKIEVWLHLKMCRLCSAFRRDLRRLRERARVQIAAQEQDESIRLKPDAKARIQAVVDREADGGEFDS
jgi:hypothetical protein